MTATSSTSTSVGARQEDLGGSRLRSRLINRATRKGDNLEEKSTEELLVEKLDKFLSTIESRLDSLDQYFKFSNEQEEEEDENEEENEEGYLSPEKTRSRSSSFTSLKSFSLSNLDMIHERLDFVKQSVLKTSFTNLEYLYKTLDDQYNYLFSSNTSAHKRIPSIDQDLSPVNKKEILSHKIITTIQYFDEKLNHIENFIHDKTPQSKIDYNKDSKFKYFKFYNFNRAVKNAEHQYLHYYELPLSWRENRYIINGYRFSLNHLTMLKSIFHFNHNETMNIWSHLIGFFVLAYLTFIHFPQTTAYQLNTYKDNLPMYGFLAAAMSCLLCSVVWHTYSCFAKLSVRTRCACVDYTGITILITASIVVAEYCSLYNYPRLLLTYMTFSIICGGTGFIFNWSPYFDKPECRSLRIGFFMGLAFLGITAFFCSCWYDGFIKSTWYFAPLVYQSFIWYWLGVVFYGGLIPERWRYDVIISEDENCNHSHSTSEILSGNIEHSGREEIENIEDEITATNFDDILISDSPEPEEAPLVDDDSNKYKEILDKHFPLKPTFTPYHKDFLSLWWVDYIFSSHNIWHICVLLGIIGHYIAILDMYEGIER